MKKLLLLVLVAVFVSCKQEITVLSAKRIVIVPGVKSAKEYATYKIKVENNSNERIKVDSVLINHENVCYKPSFILLKEGSPTQLFELDEQGNYTLSISLLNVQPEKNNCELGANSASIFISKGNVNKEIKIKAFTEERKNRR